MTKFRTHKDSAWWIDWNRGATFNVMRGETPVNCHTRYGRATAGGPCSIEEARAYAVELLNAYERTGEAPE